MTPDPRDEQDEERETSDPKPARRGGTPTERVERAVVEPPERR